MLTLALAATLVGFVLLVLGLVTGHVALAVACIVICLIGVGFLIADIVMSGRRGSDRSLSDLVGTSDDGEVFETDRSGSEDPPVATAPGQPDDLGTGQTGRPLFGEPTTAPYDDRSQSADTTRFAASGTAAPGPQQYEPQQYETPTAPTWGTASASDRGFDDYLRAVGAPQDGRSANVEPRPAVEPTTGTWPGHGDVPHHDGRHEAHRHDSHRHEAHQPSGPRHGSVESRRPADDFDPLDPSWRPPAE